MKRYLYGLNIQGIQGLIFETTKLKEIIGASDFVEQACTSLFKDMVGKNTYQKDQQIIGAAGRIQYVFEDKATCERVVMHFPKELRRKIPDIRLSQAVVAVGAELTEEDLQLLDQRLAIQSNKIPTQHGLGLMISERSRRTGAPAARISKVNGEKEFLDLKQDNKRAIANGQRDLLFEKMLGTDAYPKERYPLEIEDLLPGRGKNNEWIAVVHADGNSLGKTIQRMAKQLSSRQMQSAMKAFSKKLDTATRLAAAAAFEEVVKPVVDEEKGVIPLRPVLLGGDDITLIIRGDLALDFTAAFLANFALQTKIQFSELVERYEIKELQKGLTACAGIAYVKYNYPFHYAVDLSEELCRHTKNIAKGFDLDHIPSGLNFHRVQSSFVESYHTIIEDELTATAGENEVRLDYGPYFLEELKESGYTSIKQLKSWVREMKRKDAPKTSIRNWLTALNRDHGEAHQLMNRIQYINHKYAKRLGLQHAIRHRSVLEKEEEKEFQVTHLFDTIVLAGIK